jgi:1-acyl-sn-glycerol-3-phosphate acyltransferase
MPIGHMPFLSRSFRLCFRFVWLSAELLLAAFAYITAVALRSADRRMRTRAHWLQHSCRRVLRVLNVEVDAQGPVPSTGLLVCNHLSYLDVLVLGAFTPAVFVAKCEVRHWPVFGWFAVLAGTVFVDRQRRTQTGWTAEKIQAVLESGQLIVLFPEGTSSDGKTVLPFKSSLLEPATKTTWPLSVGVLRYGLEDGNVGEEVCYWKDMTFLPHLLNLMTKRCIQASVLFTRPQQQTRNRKELARILHSETVGLNDRHAARSGRAGLDRISELARSQNVDRWAHHKAESTSVLS